MAFGFTLPAQEKMVSDTDVSNYVGQYVAVKGLVANVHVSHAGNIFFNFERPYPNQIFCDPPVAVRDRAQYA
jgi:hypothetical protein